MPQFGEQVFVAPAAEGARDPFGRPFGPGYVTWNEHWQRSLARGDVSLGVHAGQPAPAKPEPPAAATEPEPPPAAELTPAPAPAPAAAPVADVPPAAAPPPPEDQP